MLIEFVGKFYDNHSLSIVNRNIALELVKKGLKVRIIALDSYDPMYAVNKADVRTLKTLENTEPDAVPAVQLRHTYPPIWDWPSSDTTKVVYIQPWEYPKAPFEWQYKFETFADALIVPSNYCKTVFSKGGLRPANLFVVPNGFDNKVFNKEPGNSVEKFGINADKFNFVYVGNSQWRKGLDILLHVWARTFSKSDNAKLIIKDNPRVYGKSNTLQEIVKLQYKTDCAEIIYIDEELSPTEMADIYKASKALVHPYRAEGFAMHVQEAIACGCLPIVSANGPTDDFIPQDKGLRIATQARPVNIQDPGIFALKPGDASTLMSTHTFINEPVPDYLLNTLRLVYYSHDREKLMENLKDIDTPNTWSNVVDSYAQILTSVANRKVVNRV